MRYSKVSHISYNVNVAQVSEWWIETLLMFKPQERISTSSCYWPWSFEALVVMRRFFCLVGVAFVHFLLPAQVLHTTTWLFFSCSLVSHPLYITDILAGFTRGRKEPPPALLEGQVRIWH